MNAQHWLVAMDSFKDALSSEQACTAVATGLLQGQPNLTVTTFPLADGGEGTARLLTKATGGDWHTAVVEDPLRRDITAGFGISSDQQVAYIDLAEASGLHHLKAEERNPLKTTTYGTGQLIKLALDAGVRRIVLGLGGSATNDGGMGMASALGFILTDAHGRVVEPTGEQLGRVAAIDASHADPRIRQTEFLAACDVDNPLYGPKGAAIVYGPQKGADARSVVMLDEGLKKYSQYLSALAGGSNPSYLPGAGAAGGMGAAVLVYLNARLVPGATLFFDCTGFETVLSRSSLVITGEGRIDSQTLHGKVVRAVADMARLKGIPVIGLCGQLDGDLAMVRKIGLQAAFSISRRPSILSESLASTAEDLASTAANLSSLLQNTSL